ncbi:MAG TPA: sigma 54-interacting transcriptional regulator [Myxococcales bacterium]|nr:sigma 54-interacting transcriptional regulator [Myxococcales bacterium]
MRPMLDFERVQKLHSLVLIKDVIRKWFGLELSFTDAEGAVVGRSEHTILPPQNDFCRLSLFSKEGYRRCNQSVHVLSEKASAQGKLRRAACHDCHLGFQVLGVPIALDGEYQGSVFVEGFARARPEGPAAALLLQKLHEVVGGGVSTDLGRAAARLPVLSPLEEERLSDLLELCVGEVVGSQTARSRPGQRFESLVGTSEPMQELIRLLEKVCPSDATVLIEGESGTGKELVARAIHEHGPRASGPFVGQNCSAFNDQLLESALFGHVRGSFTGAISDKKGLFEIANGGTFFLDEIGDMSPALQVKLLRVLQEGVFTPVGDTESRTVDVRIITATHKDLKVLVADGQFRQDLFYRLNVIRVRVPPLRERREDIPMLAEHFLRRLALRRGEAPRQLSPEALALLEQYDWPGNVRELENEIERLVVLGADHQVLSAEFLSPRLHGNLPEGGEGARGGHRLRRALESLERDLILQGLRRTHHNKSQLARELGVSRSNLLLKIEKYGLESPE